MNVCHLYTLSKRKKIEYSGTIAALCITLRAQSQAMRTVLKLNSLKLRL